jgi:hypothetical protein
MKIILFVMLGIVVAFSGKAQIFEQNKIVNQVWLDIPGIEDLQYLNLAYIKQTGNQNNMVAFQQNLGASANQILTEQFGENNFGTVTQTGYNHEINLFQNGTGNEAQLNFDGSLTFAEVRQSGNENSIHSNLNNFSKQIHSVMLGQEGSSNKIELTVLGSIFNPENDYTISVQQTGNDLAFQGNYESGMLPVEITQKSGINGGGMSVTVSTSAFYFPLK